MLSRVSGSADVFWSFMTPPDAHPLDGDVLALAVVELQELVADAQHLPDRPLDGLRERVLIGVELDLICDRRLLGSLNRLGRVSDRCRQRHAASGVCWRPSWPPQSRPSTQLAKGLRFRVQGFRVFKESVGVR